MLKSSLLAIIMTAAATTSTSAVTCADGDNQMSVEGVEGIFCVAGDPCLATFSIGACPPSQEGLPFGSYCGVVASGVYGCKTYTSAATDIPHPSNCTLESTEASVQGLEGAFCVNEPICVKQVSTGNCPAPQDRLLFGSFCDLLPTGVYGCRPYTADNVPTTATYEAPLDCSNNPAGDTPVSIVSANQDFCASSPICSGTIFGNCPKIQDGLVQDSECMIIETGVFGCVFMAST
ncbi:hypothetical protein PInf_010515 [Phytophthora infestans]|nr:hypothetical protein PInf_010515 [Phytophthora infestans]